MEIEGTPQGGQGQPGEGSGGAAGTPPTDPTGGQGQAQAGITGTSDTGHPGKTDGEVFFDYKTWKESLDGMPPEQAASLETAFKQMQGAFTRKMQSMSKMAEKVQAYDAFMADPAGQIRALAAQYGMQLVPGNGAHGGHAAAVEPGQQASGEWQPQSWEEVLDKLSERVMGKMQQNFQPIMENVQNLTTQSIEQKLDGIDPNWRVYEDAMKKNIRVHPTLVKDIGMLYRMSVPEEILNSRAVQTALKKLEDKGKAAQAGGGSTSVKSHPAPRQPKSFDDAVAAAKEQLGMK